MRSNGTDDTKTLDYRGRQRARYLATLLTVLFIGGLGAPSVSRADEPTSRWAPEDGDRDWHDRQWDDSDGRSVTYDLDHRRTADSLAGDWRAPTTLPRAA